MKWKCIKNNDVDYNYIPKPFKNLAEAINNLPYTYVSEDGCVFNKSVKYIQVLFKNYKCCYDFCKKYIKNIGMVSVRYYCSESTKKRPLLMFCWQHRSDDAILENIEGLARTIKNNKL